MTEMKKKIYSTTCAFSFLSFAVRPHEALFRHQQSSFIDVTIALINNIITIIIIIVTANSREQLV